MTRNLLVCGLIAGALAGLLAFGVGRVIGEPTVDSAIAFEDRSAPPSDGPVEAPIVSRTTQSTVGLLTAALAFGLAIGGLFALAFAFAYGRAMHADPGVTAAWLAAGAFVVVFLVPFLKYPANPPAVGDPATIHHRTGLFWVMTAISLVAAVAAVWFRNSVVSRMSGSSASFVSIASYLAVVLIAGLVLPTVNEVPANFPAVTLWRFREATVGIQFTLWVTIGVSFGVLAERLMRGSSSRLVPATAGAPER